LNYQETILSALIPRTQAEKATADAALKEVIKSKVSVKHFSGHYKTLFEIVALQAQRPSILDMDLLTAYLDGSSLNDQQKSEIKILYSTCKNQFMANDKLDVLCKAFIDEQNNISFGQALMTSGEILNQGKRIGKVDLKGLAAAKKYLIDSISVLQGANDNSYPSDIVPEAIPTFWDDYFRKESNPAAGLLTGLFEIDKLLNGFDPGEFAIFAAAYGEGKSTLLRNFAYHAAYVQRKNVVYFTLEMPHKQIMRELISLHSLNPMFKCPKGIHSNDIQRAGLTPEQKVLLKQVTDDLQENINYGILKIVQLPNNATVSTIRENMMYIQNEFPLHGVYVDYAALLAPEVNRGSTISEIGDTLKKLKNLANTFNNGAGIPIITAHQVSREARLRVDKSEDKRYDRSFLSDTSEAEKSADQVFWALRTDDMEKARELKMGVAKNRRGPKISDYFVRENFSCSHISSIYQPPVQNKEDIYTS
jgi:ABC-type cobalamin/Fe3+-siderophores transport system ATPase subunit